jgi:hypothetical protein
MRPILDGGRFWCAVTLSLTSAFGCAASPNAAGNGCVQSGPLLADEAHNYSFESRLTFPVTLVRPMSELDFDWGGLEHDFLGQTLDPAQDVDAVHLLLWRLTLAELEEKLHQDELRQSDLVVPASLVTGGQRTAGTLFELESAAGVPLAPEDVLPFLDIEAFPPESHIYTLMIASSDLVGQGTRMIQAFQLDADSDNTQVRVDDGSTRLNHEVDLTGAEPTQVAPQAADVVFDWSQMKTNATGEDFSLARISRAAVARFDAAPEELEEQFLSLIRYDGSIRADVVFSGEVASGTSVELSSLVNESGQAFTGIDRAGTWLFALFCGTCRSPAPWYLTFLEPCAVPMSR